MRKSVVAGAVVAIAAGIWAFAPYATGGWAEQAFRDNLQALSGHPQIDIEATSYERGWLQSRARSRLTLSTPEESVTVDLRHQIEHGPTFSLPALARVTTTPVIPEAKEKVAAHYFGDQAPLESRVRIGLTGSQHMAFASPAFHGPLHDDPSTEVDWQGLSGEGTVSPGHDRFRLELSVPGLTVSGPEGEVDLAGLSARSAMRKRGKDVWLGDSHLAVDRLRTDLPAEAAEGRLRTRLQGLTLDTDLAEGQAEDLLRMRTEGGLQSAELDGRSFTDGELALAIRRIDRPAYRELQARARELQASGLSQEALASAYMDLLRELLPRFLARSPEVAITRLALETGEGRVDGSAEAAYRGTPEPRGMPASPGQLLQRVTARAEMHMDKPLLTALLRRTAEANLAAQEGVTREQAAQRAPRVAQMRLGMLQGMGIVESDGDRFTVAAAWEEGTVTVNGQPLGMGVGGTQMP